MRFLWESNAPWAGTGYGVQTKLMLQALKGMGHEPTCFAFYGLAGGAIEYDGYKVLPNSDFEMWGNDVIVPHAERSHAECVITLMDLFVLDPERWKKLSVPWLAWVPIDSEGIGNATLERLRMCEPIAMSNFGAEQMARYDVEAAATIYHAVDVDVFQPMDKYECREMLELDTTRDVYYIGMVMANKGDRKQYPLQFKAIKQWSDTHPDVDVRVFLHTDPTSAMGGWDMSELAALSDLKGKVHSVNQYDVSVVPMAPENMARIFNCMDVLMNCSSGEGFGVPIIEAQACGVPVITHGVTAMPEVTHYGYTVESAATGLAGHYGWQFAPSVEDMVYRLECVYRMADKNKALDARRWVVENFSVPVIAAQWDYVLSELGKHLEEARADAKVSIR